MWRGRRILYVQYTNPATYPPLEHSSRILAGAGWDVLFLGVGALGAHTLSFRPHERITVRHLPFSAPGWRQKLHYARFTLWVFAWTLRWRPSWIYASDVLSCPVALLVALLPGIRCIYHEHDSPVTTGTGSNGMRSRDASPFTRFAWWCRRMLAGRAALCILPNDRRLQRFREETRRAGESLRVWNCPAREEIIAEPRALHGADDFWLLYHGSIVPSRLPLTVLAAVAQLPPNVRLRVIGYETIGHQGYQEELLRTARTLGLGGRLECIGTVPTRLELFEWCRRSHVGLALMPLQSDDVNEQAMAGASNKPFDYLACGLGVLVADLPDWREMFVGPGYGLACDPSDPDSIVASLRWFLDHPAELQGMGERGRQRIMAEWHYESQFQPVWQRLKQAVQ